MPKISILTYNIHKGFSPGRVAFQLPKMRDALAEINADIVFLQEVLGEHLREARRREDWPDATQLEYIAKEIWPHTVYGKNVIYNVGHHGSAVLSKYPISSWENIDVAKTRHASRSVLHTKIELPGMSKPLHAFCVHFGLFKHERIDQLIHLQESLCEIVDSNEPILIAGDFNDWRKDAKKYLDQLGFQEVFKELEGDYAKTYPALHPTLRTDRIYYRGLNLKQGQQFNEKKWKTLSDHLPLLAHFDLFC